MIFAVLLTIGIARRRTRNKPRTEKSRALQAIWTAMGFGIFVFAFPVALSGHFQAQSFMAAIEVMLGIAHVALRQFSALARRRLWWARCGGRRRLRAASLSGNGVAYVFLAATLVCNIGFGIYLMIRESRDKARRGRARCSMPELPNQLPDLDPVVHGKMRLAVLSLLSGVDEAEFTWLREKTGSTDGNLGAHLLKLEEAGLCGGGEEVCGA